jgi:phosphoribosyl-AMP cyclohydrolase
VTTALFERLEGATAGTSTALPDVLDSLAFDAQGLIPVIAQRHDTAEVVMFAWMNRTALEETLTTGRVCYYSRSKQRLWRKGEESGNVQRLVNLRIDCDGDVLLLAVDQTGPACHTGRRSCFYLQVERDRVVVTAAPERSPGEMYSGKD